MNLYGVAALLHVQKRWPVFLAGAGQEVDQEADGNSAMRIWKTVLFLSAALVYDSAVCAQVRNACSTFWAALLSMLAGFQWFVCQILIFSALTDVFLFRLLSVVALKWLESFELCCVDNKSSTSQCVDLMWYLFSSVRFNTGFCSHVWHSSHGVQSCLCTLSLDRFEVLDTHYFVLFKTLLIFLFY